MHERECDCHSICNLFEEYDEIVRIFLFLLSTQISDDWKFMATVIDRLFLWVFTITCLSGTFGIILRAPMLWEAPDHHPVENYTRPTVVENQSYDELVALGKVKEGLYD